MEAILHISAQQILISASVVICAPLLAFVFAFVAKKYAPAISITGISFSLAASVVLFLGIWNTGNTHHPVVNWVNLPGFQINAGFLLNNLTVLMLLLVSFIALLVNIYSVEYMRKDRLKPRYFGYLSLFCFAMLALVIADNLFLVYASWELVGFASYLLIGFWFTKETAVKANKKAFIMNRLGDIGFLAGLMIIFSQFKTLDIDTLFGTGNLIASSFVHQDLWVTPFSNLPDYWLTIAGLCFFAGAIAKSAQFPLHTWLPDAMEGPTAVSSLIHAATMVAAGVFLLVRIEPLFNDTVLLVIASIGLFTAFMAATIALTQHDIKRVLAFSTVSQLGFMMLAIGTGDSAAAIFHLVTHAFFKCLLFLGAGAVIHEMHHIKEKHPYHFDEQDMRNMGGFAKWMPVTAVVFIAASVALAGLPFSSGYLSKDAILLSVFEWANHKGSVAWLFPVVISLTSWFTVFYILRVIFKVFFGEFRLPKLLGVSLGHQPLHDPHHYMRIPIIILAIFCIAFVFALNPFSLEASWLYNAFHSKAHQESVFHLFVPIYINVLSFAILFITYRLYASGKVALNLENTWLYKFSINQWYFNELYNLLFVKTTIWLAKAWYWFDRNIIDGLVNLFGTTGVQIARLSDWFDKNVIDGLVNFSALVVERLGIWFRAVHNGKFQHYIIWMLLVFLSYFIFQMIY